MTITQLQYILAVEKYRNFTLAAEKCFVTQPTLSMQIQKFEKEFSIEIFDRNTNPIKPTKIGELLISHMEAVLHGVNKIKLLINEEKGDITGAFRIGIIPTVLSSLVPLFLKTFNKKYPESKLIIKELKTHEIISQLKNNTLDFGIVVTPLQDPQIIEHTLYYEPMVAYIPQNHSLSQRKSIDEAELDMNDILLLEDGNCFRNNVLNLCGKNQRENSISVDSGNFNTLLKLADEGFGMTILPTMFTEELSENRKKYLINFNDPIPTREVSLIHHQTQLRETFKNEFIRIIRGILRGSILFTSQNIASPNIIVPKK